MLRSRIHLFVLLGLVCFSLVPDLKAQGYLHTDGKSIVDGNGENVILRGIGTGNWMLQEGYMMKSSGVAGTQHEFRKKLIETIGEVRTDSFYNVWLQNHFTRTDADSMKAWGFNSVRVAMHYKWFTLPIEEESVSGEQTWLETGFVMMDSLLDWCGDNEMYLILDLHGAPGGQGTNADISDYDPFKPSLWESQENKDKTVALWRKLAERYSTEPWIGGYDLINETNWTFPEGNNSQLRELSENITVAIREVDTNHIIFIEGNSFANDHSGLTPPWDDNFVYSFHKYWSSTGPTDLDWIITLRNQYNVPLWLGESGENSNTWFTDLIQLSESKNIGWSWWPVKKNSINNILHVPINKEYEDLVKYWKREISSAPSEEEAFQAVLQWAENHKIENCKIQYDVIDAMIRQPHTDEVIPFTEHKLTEPIFFTDYDLGKNGIAYYDDVVAHYGGDYVAWNSGWGYRSDGVDIEICEDPDSITNGYNVGWTSDGEWMQFSMTIDSLASYTLDVRSAALAGGSKFHLEVNEVDITGTLSLPGTGDWQNWTTSSFDHIILPAGEAKVKCVIDQGGSNLSYFNFRNPRPADSIDYKLISAETSEDGSKLLITLNKVISTPDEDLLTSDFELLSDNNVVDITGITVSSKSEQILVLSIGDVLRFNNLLKLSYNGVSVQSNEQYLNTFSGIPVKNNLPDRFTIPGRIEAENFILNKGLVLETCSEGGLNTGYANAGDCLHYLVHVEASDKYQLDYRIATERSNAELVFQVGEDENFASLNTIRFKNTGGWQNWTTQSTGVYLEEGYYTVRLLVKQGEHNLNWFRLMKSTGITDGHTHKQKYTLYPNPGSQYTIVQIEDEVPQWHEITIYGMNGQVMGRYEGSESEYYIPTDNFARGVYVVQIRSNSGLHSEKLIIR